MRSRLPILRRRSPRPIGRVAGLVFLCAFIALGIISAISVRTLLSRASGQLTKYAIEGLESVLHREVRLSSLQISPSGDIRIRGFAIAGGTTFKSGELFYAKEARIRYRLKDVLRGSVDPVGGIASVSLDSPRLLVIRQANNRFNLQELFPKRKKPPQPSPFRGMVTLRNARIQFMDYAVRDLTVPQSNVVMVDRASLDAGAPPLIVATATARGVGRRIGRVTGQGSINPEEGSFTFRIGAEAQDAAYWQRYFSRIKELSVLGGRGVATISVWKPRQFAKTAAMIHVDARDVSATTRYLTAPLTRVEGSIGMSTGRPLSTTLDLRGYAGDVPVQVEGSIFTGKDPRIALRASSKNVSMAGLRRVVAGVSLPTWFSPVTPAAVRAQIFGRPGNLEVAGTVEVSRAKLYQSDIMDLRADVVYRDRVVQIPSASGWIGGAAITAAGHVDLRSGAISLVAGGKGIAANDLLPADSRLSGRVASRVSITGTTKRPWVGVEFTAGPGNFHGVPYDWVVAHLNVAGKNVRVRDAAAGLPGGNVSASGTATTDGGIDLKVVAKGIQLGRLLPAIGYKDVSGTAFADGRISGRLSDPKVQFHAQILGMNIRGQRLDLVVGDGLYRRGVVQVINGSVARYPAQGVFAGTAAIRKQGGVALDFTARLLTGRLEGILADAGVEADAEGDIRTPDAVRIRGTLAAPDITGTARVTNAFVAGYPVKSALARFHYANGLVEATGLEVIAGRDSDGEASIITAPALRLRGDRLEAPEGFKATGIHLGSLGAVGAPYLKVGGVVSITNGTLGGTRKAPLVTALVTVRGLSLNDMPFESPPATAAYNGSAITVSGLSLSRAGQGSIDVPMFKWNKETRTMSGDLRVSALRVEDVRSLLARSEWYFTPNADSLRAGLDGLARQSDTTFLSVGGGPDKPDAPMHVVGNLESFSVSGTVSLTGLKLGDEPLDRLAVGARIQGMRIRDGRLIAGTIASGEAGLTAESERMSVTGNLSGSVGGEVAAALDAINVPLAYAESFVPKLKDSGYTPHGDVTIRVDVSGKAEAPDVVASVKGNDLTVGSWRVPITVRTGEITITNQKSGPVIEAQSVTLQAKDHRITMKGSVPFSWKTMRVPADAPIEFTADVKEQNLDLLELAFGGEHRGPLQSAKGTVTAHLGVDGTLVKPNWTGHLSIEDGSVRLKPFNSVIEKINAKLTFDPVTSDILVDAFSLQSSTGGGAAARPGGVLRLTTVGERTTLVPEISLALNDLNVDEVSNGFDFGGERFRGTLSTDAKAPLTITGGPKGPRLAGTITLSNVDVLPPNQTRPAMGGASSPSIVPSFDLTLVAGKNVRVGNALYRLRVDDKRPPSERRLRITGDMNQPVVEGRFTSREGVFNYPTARFRLTDAVVGVRFPPVRGLAEGASALSFTANAQARLTAIVNGRRVPVTVYMHVEGPSTISPRTSGSGAFQTLAPYRITLRSSPSLPERQLVALISREEALQALAGGTATPEQVLRQETLNILQTSVLPGALEGFESRLGTAFGLESLSVDYLAMGQSVSVTASKRLGKRILLTYTRPVGASVTASEAYTIGLSYDVGGRLRLTLQQRKGPFLLGAHATAVSTGQTNVVETQLLLEGSMPF